VARFWAVSILNDGWLPMVLCVFFVGVVVCMGSQPRLVIGVSLFYVVSCCLVMASTAYDRCQWIGRCLVQKAKRKVNFDLNLDTGLCCIDREH
jgi:hypothetical protein